MSCNTLKQSIICNNVRIYRLILKTNKIINDFQKKKNFGEFILTVEAFLLNKEKRESIWSSSLLITQI